MISVIHVHFDCVGNMDADVDVVIQMNMTLQSVQNLTSINIKRRKACRKSKCQFISIVRPAVHSLPAVFRDWKCVTVI